MEKNKSRNNFWTPLEEPAITIQRHEKLDIVLLLHNEKMRFHTEARKHTKLTLKWNRKPEELPSSGTRYKTAFFPGRSSICQQFAKFYTKCPSAEGAWNSSPTVLTAKASTLLTSLGLTLERPWDRMTYLGLGAFRIMEKYMTK